VTDEHLRERSVGQVRRSQEASEERERCRVQLGPLAPPLLDDQVDEVGVLLGHCSRILLGYILPKKHLTSKLTKEDFVSDKPTQHDAPPTMLAVRLHPPGGIEGLAYERVETPRLRAGEALVRVHAAAITRDELTWAEDRLPAIPSYEVSGVVAALAPGVTGIAVGDAVYALTCFDRDGAAAEYVAVPADLLAPKPATLGHVESAAIPLAALSALQGLFDHGGLEEGQRVLVTGAAGGVGHFATQLARLRGAQVIAAGFDEAAVDGVDLVFDTAGGDLLARSRAIVREGGRVVSVAEEPPPISSSAKVEARYFVVEPNRRQLEELTRLVERGELSPAVDSVFHLADARSAFERSMARGKRGKVVLRVVEEEVTTAIAASPRG
jgi:NADPH:quinone reductase-like Zn-dependent oxidoreductase